MKSLVKPNFTSFPFRHLLPKSFPSFFMKFTGLKMIFGFWLSFVDSFSFSCRFTNHLVWSFFRIISSLVFWSINVHRFTFFTFYMPLSFSYCFLHLLVLPSCICMIPSAFLLFTYFITSLWTIFLKAFHRLGASSLINSSTLSWNVAFLLFSLNFQTVLSAVWLLFTTVFHFLLSMHFTPADVAILRKLLSNFFILYNFCCFHQPTQNPSQFHFHSFCMLYSTGLFLKPCFWHTRLHRKTQTVFFNISFADSIIHTLKTVNSPPDRSFKLPQTKNHYTMVL